VPLSSPPTQAFPTVSMPAGTTVAGYCTGALLRLEFHHQGHAVLIDRDGFTAFTCKKKTAISTPAGVAAVNKAKLRRQPFVRTLY
jgi:hypothetical protein